MQLGEFIITGLEQVDESPGPTGQALVLVPEKPEPLPNANTIEGVIQGAGLMASGARRRGGAPRVFMTVFALSLTLPALWGFVVYFASLFH